MRLTQVNYGFTNVNAHLGESFSRAVLRVETASENLYHSIDQLVEKIDRVLNRHKTKLLGRAKSAKGESIRRTGFEAEAAEPDETTKEFFEDMEGVYVTFQDDEEEVSAGESAGS